MKTLYVSDMDGTLLDSQSRIPPQAVKTLNEAIADGALFTVATARTPATLSRLLENVDLRLPAIVMTGATTWHRDTNTYVNTHHFPSATAREILQTYRHHRLPSFIYTLRDNMINIYHYGPLSPLEKDFIRQRIDSPFKHFHLSPIQKLMLENDEITESIAGDVWEESLSHIPEKISDAVLFFAMQDERIGIPAYESLRDIPDINPIFYYDTVYPGNAMIEAFPGPATKAKAIKELAKRIGADRIVVFGDNRNDLPMFEIATLAVATENAIPEVKQKAHLVIGTNDSGAVADFIREDFDQPEDIDPDLIR